MANMVGLGSIGSMFAQDDQNTVPLANLGQAIAPDAALLSQAAKGQSQVGSKLAPSQEMVFNRWLMALPWAQEFQQRYGERPNPNDRMYDYRKAWQAGVAPERYQYDNNAYHWPSTTPDGQFTLKGPDHPTLWAEDFMRQSGGVDPFSIGIEDPLSARLYLGGARPQK